MKLEDIGFYTLSDYRAKNTAIDSPMWRCELILTDRCNFHCPYCRGIKNPIGDLSFIDAVSTVRKWKDGGLKNIRFSGGEPTLWDGLPELVAQTKEWGVERIAISTNGSADMRLYDELLDAGVNDFSISLDACCSSVGDIMAGNINGAWDKVVETISVLSKKAYVTVGVVVDDNNICELHKMASFAQSLGVADIRILSAAQWNNKEKFRNLCTDSGILNSNAILKYRVDNFNNGRNVRGLNDGDSHQCWLMLDDMAVMDNKHYPCIIHMRENGGAVGSVVGKDINKIRKERFDYITSHDTFLDQICRKNCLDVCVDYNNRVEQTNKNIRQ